MDRVFRGFRTIALRTTWLLAGAFAVAPVLAQQVTGQLGAPSATTTIPGNQIPAPEPKFGGVIKENAANSKPWWPPTIVPPKGAPNILLIMDVERSTRDYHR